jgi:hypothetical protein
MSRSKTADATSQVAGHAKFQAANPSSRCSSKGMRRTYILWLHRAWRWFEFYARAHAPPWLQRLQAPSEDTESHVEHDDSAHDFTNANICTAPTLPTSSCRTTPGYEPRSSSSTSTRSARHQPHAKLVISLTTAFSDICKKLPTVIFKVQNTVHDSRTVKKKTAQFFAPSAKEATPPITTTSSTTTTSTTTTTSG